MGEDPLRERITPPSPPGLKAMEGYKAGRTSPPPTGDSNSVLEAYSRYTTASPPTESSSNPESISAGYVEAGWVSSPPPAYGSSIYAGSQPVLRSPSRTQSPPSKARQVNGQALLGEIEATKSSSRSSSPPAPVRTSPTYAKAADVRSSSSPSHEKDRNVEMAEELLATMPPGAEGREEMENIVAKLKKLAKDERNDKEQAAAKARTKNPPPTKARELNGEALLVAANGRKDGSPVSPQDAAIKSRMEKSIERKKSEGRAVSPPPRSVCSLALTLTLTLPLILPLTLTLT